MNNVICKGLKFKEPISYKDLEKGINLKPPYQNVLAFINNNDVVKYKRGATRYFIDDTEQYIKILLKDKSVELFDSNTNQIITDKIECPINMNLSQDTLAQTVRTSYNNTFKITAQIVNCKIVAEKAYVEAMKEWNNTNCDPQKIKTLQKNTREQANYAQTFAATVKTEADTAKNAFNQIKVNTHLEEELKHLPSLVDDNLSRAQLAAKEVLQIADNSENITFSSWCRVQNANSTT